MFMLNNFLFLILVMMMIMISVAFFTLYERKIMGNFHYRKGPNKVSMLGILQPFSDAFKLLTKEFFYPKNSNFYIYLISPMIMLILIILMWLIYPFLSNLIMFKYSMLYFLSVLSVGVYSIMIGGWSSNSSFSMIGAIRSVAQSISYEVIFSISLMIIFLFLMSNNFFNIIMFNNKFVFLMFTNFIFFFISCLAEINRTPFDLSEGESELVSGFNIEYGGVKFTLIFLSEYASILLMMFLINFMYFFENSFFFLFNYFFLIYFITWIRITFPRLRYDKLMYLCWFFILPMVLLLWMYMIFFIYFTIVFFLNNYKY